MDASQRNASSPNRYFASLSWIFQAFARVIHHRRTGLLSQVWHSYRWVRQLRIRKWWHDDQGFWIDYTIFNRNHAILYSHEKMLSDLSVIKRECHWTSITSSLQMNRNRSYRFEHNKSEFVQCAITMYNRLLSSIIYSPIESILYIYGTFMEVWTNGGYPKTDGL